MEVARKSKQTSSRRCRSYLSAVMRKKPTDGQVSKSCKLRMMSADGQGGESLTGPLDELEEVLQSA